MFLDSRGQVRSSGVKWGQEESSGVNCGQERSIAIWVKLVRLGELRCGWVGLGPFEIE